MRMFILFTLVLHLLGAATPVAARTLIVRTDGISDVPTIQDAFNAADPGDDIVVGPGTYFESDILCKPGVFLHSEAGAAETRIDATGGLYGVYGEEPGAPWIDGFTVFGSSNATIAVLAGGSQPIANCVVYGGGAGIYARYYTGVLAHVTAVAGDGTVHSGSGISLSHSSPTLYNCICAFNDGYGVVEWAPPYSPKDISCCCAYANGGGNYEGIFDPTGQGGNIDINPLFCDLANRDLGLLENSPCAPYTPPNVECQQIGALPVGCTTKSNRRPGVTLTAAPTIFAPGAEFVRLMWQLPPGIGANDIALSIVDANGRTVRHLETVSATWDGLDQRGQPVSSGIYYGRLRVAGGNVTKMLLCVR